MARQPKLWLIVLVSLLAAVVMVEGARPASAAPGDLISRVYTDNARYSPQDSVTVTVEIDNQTGSAWTGTLTMDITHLGVQVDTDSQALSVGSDATTTETFVWQAPATDFTGYLVEIAAGTTDAATTAIDVSSDWHRFPRYGYVHDFDPGQSQAESEEKMQLLAEDYNISAVQFYDWMWRHEQVISRTGGVIDDPWDDWAGNPISFDVVTDLVDAGHDVNTAALPYFMIYGGLQGYEQTSNVDPEWGVYLDTAHTNQAHFDFGLDDPNLNLWIFNPTNNDWQDHLLGEVDDAVSEAGFDGVHLDQMGNYWNTTYYDYWGNEIDLGTSFASAIATAKEHLTDTTPSTSTVAFNMVNGGTDAWGVDNVTTYSPVDFLYSEIWENSSTYGSIENFVRNARADSGGKAMVLAAYMNFEENTGAGYEAENATLSGVGTNDNHSGYTGSGFVDGFGDANDYVEFSISVPEDGKYSLVFRYANDTGNTATRTVRVDGSPVDQIEFLDQSGWTDWDFDAYTVADLTAGAHTVRLAVEAGDSGFINLDSLTLGAFDESSVRLANAAFAASGSYQIQMGEGDQMLGHPYFPNESKQMRSSLRSAMKDHYTFITAYENLLFDPDMIPGDAGQQWIDIDGQTVSGDGSADSIWALTRRNADYEVIHLVNLLGNDATWRNSASTPTTLTDFDVTYRLGPDATINGVYLASPDIDGGVSDALSYSTGSDSEGTYVTFTVPSLEYWDMIYIDRDVTAPSGDIYEAETALKTAVATNTNHAGYTGSGFVDSFATSGDAVSFVVDVPTDTTYTLSFRYTNATGDPASRMLFVDGRQIANVDFPNRYSWSTWEEVERSVELGAGVHQVVLYYGGSNTGGINLDHLEVIDETHPSATSATAVWMNNWSDTIAIHMASKLHPAHTDTQYGPRLAELHFAGDWPTNQIVDATGYFIDETASVNYTSVNPFDSETWFEDDGTLTVNYLNYDDEPLPVNITKRYAMVPEQNFIVVEYTFENLTSSPRTMNLLEQVHLNNKTWGSGSVADQEGWYDSSRNTLGADMSASGQYHIQLGSFQTMDSYQVADDANTNPSATTSSGWHQFDTNGTLNNNGNIFTEDLSLAFQDAVVVPASGTATRAFFYVIEDTKSQAEAVADVARAQTASYWFGETADAYADWLDSGVEVSVADEGLNTAYTRSQVINKQSQHPTFGNWPAATNIPYEYKVWVRDSAVTAIAMDATGHRDDARKYWEWMASVQSGAGNYTTNYSIWHPNQPISFVEPEEDDLGLLLMGIYRHYELTAAENATQAADFLDDMWDAVEGAADYIVNNLESNDFGPRDASIWEEGIEFNTFTQVLYVHGLHAASLLATEAGETTLAATYEDTAETIRDAILRSFNDSPSGLWNDSNQYFNRAVNTDGTARDTIDGSSNLVWVFGLLDADDPRIRDHRTKTLGRLTNDGWGVARYEGDEFYHESTFSPGGQYEALAAESVWPQMTMYAALLDQWADREDDALARLQWYVARTGRGYVTPGEPVDWVTSQPLVSTMIEPVTGAWYQLGLLNYVGEFDPRMPQLGP